MNEKDVIEPETIKDENLPLPVIANEVKSDSFNTMTKKIQGVFLVGDNSVIIDGPNRRIIINDGTTNRIVIGEV